VDIPPRATHVRILFACEFYEPSVGGVQEVVRQIALRLVERGHQVTVATSHLSERRSKDINGVEVAEFKVEGNLVRGMSGEINAYRDYVLKGEYDLFLVKAAQQWTFDALIPVLDRMTKPRIFVPCGFSGLYEPMFAQYYRRMPELLRMFDHLIFYASDYRDINLARDHGLTHFTVLPNGASEREFLVSRDPGFRKRYDIPEKAFVVLTVGNLSGLKGHRELAEAFRQVRFQDGKPAILMLNGNKPERRTLRGYGPLQHLRRKVKALLLELGLDGLLKVTGYKLEPSLDSLIAQINRAAPAKRAMLVDLPRPEVVQAYLNSDLFVFASNIEYSPLVLFESAAAGLPFISVPVGNAEEIARWTGAGEICPAPRDALGYTRPDPAALAKHIESLAVRADDRRSYGEAGKRNWREQFTWQKIADRYEEVFIRLLEEKAGHAATDARATAGQQF
jgi:glycosyltransferase involved in cell wall biosynthesis